MGISLGLDFKSLHLLPFLVHYANRSLLYPLLLNKSSRPVPLLTTANAFIFCLFNGLLQSQAIVNLDAAKLILPLSCLGLLLFLLGMAINMHSDSVLRGLRAPGETGYRIPYGGLFSHISAPNYFGETLEWCGFAAVAQTQAALWFAIWNLLFLGNRAMQTHKWYLEKFGGEYPASRKAFIPFLL